MRSIITLSIVFFLSSVSSVASQNNPMSWTNTLTGGLTISQSQFSNWSAGGTDTFSWLAQADGVFSHTKKNRTWRNMIQFRYGAAEVGDADSQKSEDVLRAETLYTFNSEKNVRLYTGATLLTQFSKSYDHSSGTKVAVSNFLDPGYFTQSIGYEVAIDTHLNTRLGAALKETVTKKYQHFSDSKDLLVEYGIEAVAEYKRELKEGTTFNSKLDLFYAGEGLDNVDYYWDNRLSSQIMKGISVILNYKLVYDKDASEEVQSMNSMSMGILYRFI